MPKVDKTVKPLIDDTVQLIENELNNALVTLNEFKVLSAKYFANDEHNQALWDEAAQKLEKLNRIIKGASKL